MIKLLRTLFFFASWASALLTGCGRENAKARPGGDLDALLTPLPVIEEAYSGRRSDIPVVVEGRVVQLLRDDNEGERHQRFVIGLSNGQTILVTHNIDIAPRVEGICEGDTVFVKGEYIWNERGGLIHWTHHDPNGSHQGGWVVHQGNKYE